MVEFRDVNISLAIDIVSYEYDNSRHKGFGFDEDSNWLMLKFEVTHLGERLVHTIPCLLTTELIEVVHNMELVEKGKIKRYSSNFIEPDFMLSFLREQEEFIIHIRLSFSGGLEDCDWIETETRVSKKRWEELIDQIRGASKRFPVR